MSFNLESLKSQKFVWEWYASMGEDDPQRELAHWRWSQGEELKAKAEYIRNHTRWLAERMNAVMSMFAQPDAVQKAIPNSIGEIQGQGTNIDVTIVAFCTLRDALCRFDAAMFKGNGKPKAK